jgi:hypothetical protein
MSARATRDWPATSAREPVGKGTIAWIAARDGSVHATRIPIMAAGQLMLCGRSYSRVDLRVAPQGKSGPSPEKQCPRCREAAIAAPLAP